MSGSDAPGPLLASGRATDVYDLGDGRVLRRYRADHPDIEAEARVMRLVASHGFPVPEVFDADGRDLVLSRVDGPTMLDDLRTRPTAVLGHARRLARLQQRLAEIPAPDWLMAPGWTPDPAGDRVLHLDLHPMNVMLGPDGPVVIDWTDTAAGPPGFDAAISYVAMAAYETGGGRDRLAQRVVVEGFRRYRGRVLVDAFLAAACDHRLADPNLTPGERVAVAALRTRTRRRGSSRP